MRCLIKMTKEWMGKQDWKMVRVLVMFWQMFWQRIWGRGKRRRIKKKMRSKMRTLLIKKDARMKRTVLGLKQSL